MCGLLGDCVTDPLGGRVSVEVDDAGGMDQGSYGSGLPVGEDVHVTHARFLSLGTGGSCGP